MLSQQTGKAAEDKALAYLMQRGFQLIVRNFSCRAGEIDLIMWDEKHLVFIEVRLRSSTEYGSGAVSITLAKKRKIINTAHYYLLKYCLYEQAPLRFDVVSIDGYAGHVTWIKDAFGVDY